MNKKSWRSIVVAIGDPCRRKQPALHKAAKIAARAGARLTLLHTFAFPYPLPKPSPVDSKQMIEGTKTIHLRYLTQLAKPLRARGLKVDCAVEWDYPPHEAIVRYLIRHETDLLIAELHRHGRLARWLLTNTDWNLIRECPCPLWFVKSPELPDKFLVLAAVDPMYLHANPSGLDDRIIEHARQVQRHFGGSVYLGHACEVPMVLAPSTYPEPVVVPMPEEDARRFKERADREVAQLAKRHRIPAGQRLVREGDPVRVLDTMVEEVKADLLVMGAVSRRGAARRGAARVFIGNTAEKVIDRVGCDVLVIKPAKFRSEVPHLRPN